MKITLVLKWLVLTMIFCGYKKVKNALKKWCVISNHRECIIWIFQSDYNNNKTHMCVERFCFVLLASSKCLHLCCMQVATQRYNTIAMAALLHDGISQPVSFSLLSFLHLWSPLSRLPFLSNSLLANSVLHSVALPPPLLSVSPSRYLFAIFYFCRAIKRYFFSHIIP